MKKIEVALILAVSFPALFMGGCSNNQSGPSMAAQSQAEYEAECFRRDRKTPTKTPTAVPKATKTHTVCVTPNVTGTATATPKSTKTATPAVTPGVTGSPTSAATSTPAVTAGVTGSPTSEATPAETSSVTVSPTATATPQEAQAPVQLRSAAGFVVLAATTITNSGPTTLCGDLGLYPGSAVTGAPVMACGGVQHVTDDVAAQAQADLTTAYNDAAGRTNPALLAGDLGGLTLYSGLYKSTSTLGLTGDLILDAQGDPNAVFIFQVGSSLITENGSEIILVGGAQAANIFWQVGSSAALGTDSIFKGTIMALTSITLNTGAVLDGRALARNADVTLLSNTLTEPAP